MIDFDDGAADAFDASTIADHDAVSRLLIADSERLLRLIGGGTERERALSIARVIVLLVVLTGVSQLVDYLRQIEHLEALRDDWQQLTDDQQAVARLLFAIVTNRLAAEGALR